MVFLPHVEKIRFLTSGYSQNFRITSEFLFRSRKFYLITAVIQNAGIKLLGLVFDSKKKLGPDSRTTQKKSDGLSDFFGQKDIFRVGQKSDKIVLLNRYRRRFSFVGK